MELGREGKNIHLKMTVRLVDENGEKAFGTGVAQLLRRIETAGSLNQAAKSMGIAYSKAWKILHNAETLLGISFVEKSIGGTHGGGSRLTGEGIAFLEKYEAFTREASRRTEELFYQMFQA